MQPEKEGYKYVVVRLIHHLPALAHKLFRENAHGVFVHISLSLSSLSPPFALRNHFVRLLWVQCSFWHYY